MIPKYTVIQYIRDKNNNPRGVLVAVKHENGFRIGYSLCNKKDRFNKNMALKIALGRANAMSDGPIPHPVDRMLEEFTNRCKRYYKVSA